MKTVKIISNIFAVVSLIGVVSGYIESNFSLMTFSLIMASFWYLFGNKIIKQS